MEGEGGEGDAGGHQDEGEEPPSAGTDCLKLIGIIPGFVLILVFDLVGIYSLICNAYCTAVIQ